MKKRLVTAMVALGMAVSICACGGTQAASVADTAAGESTEEAVAADTESETDISDEAGMDPEAENQAVQDTLTYMGGLYTNKDPENDMELAIFRNEDGDVIYLIYELGTINYGFYATEDAETEDGTVYEKIIVDDDTVYGYYFSEDLTEGILVGSDGVVRDALELDESVARDLVKQTVAGE